MLTTFGRAAVQRLPLRTIATSSVVSRLVSRAALTQRGLSVSVSDLSRSGALRSFATKTETSKKPAKKATKKTTTKTKAAAKPKPKKKVKKVVKKPVARKVKKPLSPERQEKLEIKELKKTSLYAVEPKAKDKLPAVAYILYISEQLKGTSRDIAATQAAFTETTQQWKSISSSELARLKRTAEENKLQNEAKYKAWVESYPVEEIQKANRARQLLKRKYDCPKKVLHLLKDDRRPMGTRGPFAYFTKARWASGDFENRSAPEVLKIVSEEWKNMSESDKTPYIELYHADQARRSREQSAISE
ncbi:hypothetical protein G7054_g3618 [Neopestalotiopsis clavispora]|nr:hypothetical protein G7054_g3618 [Neopestalotiopsis clavispora]